MQKSHQCQMRNRNHTALVNVVSISAIVPGTLRMTVLCKVRAVCEMVPRTDNPYQNNIQGQITPTKCSVQGQKTQTSVTLKGG